MKRKVIINKFGPSAKQILDATHAVATSPETTLVVGEVPAGTPVFGDRVFEGRRKKDYDRGLAYIHEMAERTGLKNQVFLGGSCNPTSWRQEIAIPMLEAAGCAYFNPQVDDWDARHQALIAQGVKGGMMEFEAQEKTTSHVILFVFDALTRAIATINEATEFMTTSHQKVLLVMAYIKPGVVIGDQEVNAEEAMDINIARAELKGLARGYAVPVFDRVEDAVAEVIKILKDAEQDLIVAAAR